MKNQYRSMIASVKKFAKSPPNFVLWLVGAIAIWEVNGLSSGIRIYFENWQELLAGFANPNVPFAAKSLIFGLFFLLTSISMLSLNLAFTIVIERHERFGFVPKL